MVNKQTKRAFTLAEIIISFMIIMLVAISMIPVLTKAKPRIEQIGVRGQFGCWWENGKLYEQYFDERSPRDEKRDVTSQGECKLILDQRPQHFYMIGVGAGSNIMGGKVSMRYTPALNNQLTVTAGKYDVSNHEISQTIITSGTSPELVAAGGAWDVSLSQPSLFSENISQNCTIDNSSCNATICTIKEIIARDAFGIISSRTYSAVLEGNDACIVYDEYGNQTNANVVELNNCTLQFGRSGNMNFDDMTESQAQQLANANNVYWRCIDNAGRNHSLNFQYNDSYYMLPQHLLDFNNNNSYIVQLENTPRFSRIMQEIAPRRRSQLTQFYANSTFGAKQKDGAVLILW